MRPESRSSAVADNKTSVKRIRGKRGRQDVPFHGAFEEMTFWRSTCVNRSFTRTVREGMRESMLDQCRAALGIGIARRRGWVGQRCQNQGVLCERSGVRLVKGNPNMVCVIHCISKSFACTRQALAGNSIVNRYRALLQAKISVRRFPFAMNKREAPAERGFVEMTALRCGQFLNVLRYSIVWFRRPHCAIHERLRNRFGIGRCECRQTIQ